MIVSPKVLYENPRKWEEKKKEAYKIIKDGIYKWVIEDEFEYIGMSSFGITPRQEMFIPNYIVEGLILLTNNKEWSQSVSRDIMDGISGFANGLIKAKLWDKLYFESTNVELANMIYFNIEYQLGDGTHSPNILEDIPQYKCNKCNKLDGYSENNMCISCDSGNE